MKRFQFLTGFLCGALLFCAFPTVASAASNIMAAISNQPVYVDGQRVYMTAYAIGGSNYVKLRDVGEAVGFNVYWDGGAVQVESDKPYTGEGPKAQPPAPAAVTEESVRAALAALRERYPNGASWPSPYRSASGGPYHSGMNCAGWATLCSEAHFDVIRNYIVQFLLAFLLCSFQSLTHPCF